MKQIPKKLSGFALKYIAMVSMLCDHANMLVIRRGFFAPFRGEDGSTLIPQNAPAWLGAVQGVYRVFDVLGHLAFPLYVFLLAEGFTHTRDRKRYFLTLLAFALISEPVFNLAHYEQWTGPALQNVLFTLSLSCLEIFVLARIESDAAERGKRIALYVLTCLVFGAAAFAVRLKANAAAACVGVVVTLLVPAVGNYYMSDALTGGGSVGWTYVGLAAMATLPLELIFLFLGFNFANGRDMT